MVNENRPLDPAEQNHLLDGITLLLTHTLPAGWEQATVQYAGLGSRTETRLQYKHLAQQFPTRIEPPAELEELFTALRSGMYSPGTGTWFTAVFTLDFPFTYNITYERQAEPDLSAPPPASVYEKELEAFPRDPEHTPSWLSEAAAQGGERIRNAKLFDSLTPEGTPVVDRAPVPAEQREALLTYLEKCPIVLAAHSYQEDMIDPSLTPRVPLTFHTDGVWVWPGASAYYLRVHDVAPDPELVEHIRAVDFLVPQPGRDELNEALEVITGPRG
ncbi:ferredoxin [Actinomadura roseirufa]|uniref:ferredoxin n=1 Tax=Actinomadura roseirufa TaxID=2094049 RepID=UPI0010416DAB|nr:ferredoxin [Actinomadura roseirufa]